MTASTDGRVVLMAAGNVMKMWDSEMKSECQVVNPCLFFTCILLLGNCTMVYSSWTLQDHVNCIMLYAMMIIVLLDI